MNLDETSSDNICSLYTKNVSTFESSSSSISKKPDKKLELDKILNKSPVRSFTEKISNSATHSNKMTQKTKIETLSFQSTDIDEIVSCINFYCFL